MTLRTRLSLSFAAVVVFAVVAVSVALIRTTEARILASVRANLVAEARITGDLIASRGLGVPGGSRRRLVPAVMAPDSQSLLGKIEKQTGHRTTIMAIDGTVLGDSRSSPARMENHANRPEVKAAIRSGAGSDIRLSRTVGTRYLYVAVRSATAQGVPFITRLAVPLSSVQATLDEVTRAAVGVAMLVLVVGMAAAFTLARSLARPIQQLAAAAPRIARGGSPGDIALQRADEIGDLSRALARMAEGLDARLTELTAEKEKLRMILDNMTDGILLVDSQADVVLANAAAGRIFKRPEDELTSKPLTLSVISSGVEQTVRKALATGAAADATAELWTPEQRTLRVVALPLRDEAPPAGALVVVSDVTDQRRLDQTRRDFVANVSHELKTPITSIHLAAETLTAALHTDPEAARKFAESIEEEARRLSMIVNDLLNLSRYESSDARAGFIPLQLNDVVREIVSQFERQAAALSLTIEADLAPDLPPVLGGHEQLGSLIANLIDNALAYTPAGGSVRVRTQSGGRQALLGVTDTGVGIPEADQPRVFERFYRVDKARSRHGGRTGLGLSIVKHVAEAHEASIDLASAPGEGTTVTVTFPAAED